MNIIQVVIGLMLALFIPGYLIARTFFKELSELEKIALGFVLSICVDIFLGLFLGYNEKMKNLTGGITAYNLWLYLGIITTILIIFYSIGNWEEMQRIWDYFFYNPKKIKDKPNIEIQKKPVPERYKIVLQQNKPEPPKTVLIKRSDEKEFKQDYK